MRFVVASALAVVLAAAAVPAASAHEDPPSDVLEGAGDVFLSLQSPAETAEGRRLEALAATARRHGFRVKIAVVAKPADLGKRLAFFGRPRAYAKVLGNDLRLDRIGALVVVMGGPHAGVAVYPDARRTPAVGVPADASAARLGRVAEVAVRRVAADAGHPLPTPRVAAKGSGDSTRRDRMIILVVALAVALVFALAPAGRRRTRSAG